MITDLYKLCLAHLGSTLKDYSPLTTRGYERTYRQFVGYVQSLGLRDDVKNFTDETVHGFHEELARLGISTNVIVTKLAALSTLAKYGMQHKDSKGRRYLDHNPVTSFEWPQTVKRERPYLYPKELAAFLAVELEGSWRILARALLVDTGLRSLELARAKVGDLHDVNGLYYLAVTVKGRGRNRRKLDIPISPDVATLINNILLTEGRIHPGDPLLVNSAGEPISTSSLTHLVTTTANRAGITRFRVGAHTVRHTMEVVRRRGGVSPFLRSKLMGHASENSIHAYGHVVDDELHEARRQQREGLAHYLGEHFPARQDNAPRAEQSAERETDKPRGITDT